MMRPIPRRPLPSPKSSMPAVVVPRLWPGATIVCIASGPSLTQADVDSVRGKAKVIVINTSYLKAPWADVLYACDAKWWKWNKGAPSFHGLKYALTTESGRWPGVQVLKRGGTDGLSLKPTSLVTGSNSGYQAVNLAFHLGGPGCRIVLLGYDMQRGPKGEEHWHPDHPMKSRNPYKQWIRLFGTLVKPLQDKGVEIINCSRRTALECFPGRPLQEVFPDVAIEGVA